jgi:hypothetical protein
MSELVETMKENERLKKIRDLLLQQQKANWTSILEKTGIQSKELSYDLMKLIRNGEITTEQDTKDRGKTWYMLKDQNKALAESKRFESIEFIQSLGPELNFAEAESKMKGLHCKSSVFTNQKNVPKQDMEKIAKTITDSFIPMLIKKFELEKLKTKPPFKNACIITLEKEDSQ